MRKQKYCKEENGRKKGKFLRIGVVVFLVTLSLVAIGMNIHTIPQKAAEEKTDSMKFKESYEEWNGKTRDDGTYLSPVSIPEDNKISYMSTGDAWKMIEERKTGIVFLGADWCRWCRVIAPLVADISASDEIEQIYYVEIEKEESGETEKTQEEKELINAIGEYLEKAGTSYVNVTGTQGMIAYYQEQLEEGSQEFFYPVILFIKDGSIIGMHVGTVTDQVDVSQELTPEQIEEFEENFQKHVSVMEKELCPWKC